MLTTRDAGKRCRGGPCAGSFFYFSSDNRFLVKTISQAESRTLQRILPDYLKHMLENRNTLLSRIFGLYKLKMDDTTSIFVIMGNVFNPTVPIHQRYDLKVRVAGQLHTHHPGALTCARSLGWGGAQGSTHGRTVGEAHLHEKGVVLKDLDFIKLGTMAAHPPAVVARKLVNRTNECGVVAGLDGVRRVSPGRKINVGPDLRTPLIAQIRSDSDFLTVRGPWVLVLREPVR